METMNSATWRKSSYSGTNGGGCVEAGVAEQGRVMVRDTTNRGGAVLNVSAKAWQRLTSSLQ
jgi:xanthine/CO dehydrogenase XdhC/CoxF family maturation factor